MRMSPCLSTASRKLYLVYIVVDVVGFSYECIMWIS